MAKTKFLFSTDFHGSETVWRKVLNAAKYFDLDALVISGDMTGKLLVPIVERPDGRYDATFYGQGEVLTEEEVPEFEKKCRSICYIPYRTTAEEVERLAADEQYKEDVFEKMECEVIKYWLTLIPDRVPSSVKVIISPGNDDKFSIDEVIRADPNPQVIFGEEEVVQLDEEHEVLCFGWSNPTPFDSPREASEEELEAKLERVVAQVKNMKTAVFCIHAPPYNSFLDQAPLLEDDLSVSTKGGHTRYVAVGSTAVRKIIEKYQPFLGLHGHIHESPGRIKIGRTECLNPGSEYAEGILKGFLVEIDGDKLVQLRRVDA
jgi:Icc-related predicted phosphoesterase